MSVGTLSIDCKFSCHKRCLRQSTLERACEAPSSVSSSKSGKRSKQQHHSSSSRTQPSSSTPSSSSSSDSCKRVPSLRSSGSQSASASSVLDADASMSCSTSSTLGVSTDRTLTGEPSDDEEHTTSDSLTQQNLHVVIRKNSLHGSSDEEGQDDNADDRRVSSDSSESSSSSDDDDWHTKPPSLASKLRRGLTHRASSRPGKRSNTISECDPSGASAVPPTNLNKSRVKRLLLKTQSEDSSSTLKKLQQQQQQQQQPSSGTSTAPATGLGASPLASASSSLSSSSSSSSPGLVPFDRNSSEPLLSPRPNVAAPDAVAPSVSDPPEEITTRPAAKSFLPTLRNRSNTARLVATATAAAGQQTAKAIERIILPLSSEPSKDSSGSGGSKKKVATLRGKNSMRHQIVEGSLDWALRNVTRLVFKSCANGKLLRAVQFSNKSSKKLASSSKPSAPTLSDSSPTAPMGIGSIPLNHSSPASVPNLNLVPLGSSPSVTSSPLSSSYSSSSSSSKRSYVAATGKIGSSAFKVTSSTAELFRFEWLRGRVCRIRQCFAPMYWTVDPTGPKAIVLEPLILASQGSNAPAVVVLDSHPSDLSSAPLSSSVDSTSGSVDTEASDQFDPESFLLSPRTQTQLMPYANTPQAQEFTLVVHDNRFSLQHVATEKWVCVSPQGELFLSDRVDKKDAAELATTLFQVCIKVALKLASTNKYLKAPMSSSGIQVPALFSSSSPSCCRALSHCGYTIE